MAALAAQIEAMRAQMETMRAEVSQLRTAAAAQRPAQAVAAASAAAAAESAALRLEVERLRRLVVAAPAQRECPLCMEEERPRDTALVPCGHTYCAPCVAALPGRECPDCRTPFGRTIRVFL